MGITLRMSQYHWLVLEIWGFYIFSVTCCYFAFLYTNLYNIPLILGRIMSKRSSSSKLFFYDLHGDGAKVQVMADARYLMIIISSYLHIDIPCSFCIYVRSLGQIIFNRGFC